MRSVRWWTEHQGGGSPTRARRCARAARRRETWGIGAVHRPLRRDEGTRPDLVPPHLSVDVGMHQQAPPTQSSAQLAADHVIVLTPVQSLQEVALVIGRQHGVRLTVAVAEGPDDVAPRQPERLRLDPAGQPPGPGVARRKRGYVVRRSDRAGVHRLRPLLQPQGAAGHQSVDRRRVDPVPHAPRPGPVPGRRQQVRARDAAVDEVGVRAFHGQVPAELLPGRDGDRLGQRGRRGAREQGGNRRPDERHQRDQVLALGVLAADLEPAPSWPDEQARARRGLRDECGGHGTVTGEAAAHVDHPVVRHAQVDVGGEAGDPIRARHLGHARTEHAALGGEHRVEGSGR